MTSFVLIPGADGSAWYWHRVVPLLREAGHENVAVDLPGDDETVGSPSTQAWSPAPSAAATMWRSSLGGFTAPLAAARPGVRALVFVNAMIPVRPRERGGATPDGSRRGSTRR